VKNPYLTKLILTELGEQY